MPTVYKFFMSDQVCVVDYFGWLIIQLKSGYGACHSPLRRVR